MKCWRNSATNPCDKNEKAVKEWPGGAKGDSQRAVTRRRIKVPYDPQKYRLVIAVRGVGAVQGKRTIFRKRVLKTAQIVLSEKAPKHDCSIRNLSDTRACLQVSTTYGIPTNFEIIIEGERVGRLVRLQE